MSTLFTFHIQKFNKQRYEAGELWAVLLSWYLYSSLQHVWERYFLYKYDWVWSIIRVCPILSWETLDNPYFVYSELYLSLLSSVRFSFSIMNFINLMYFNFSIIKFKFQYLWLSFNIFIVFSVRYLHKWEIKYFKAITMILFSLVYDHGKILRKETFSLAFSIMTKPDVTIIKSGIIFISCLKSKDRDIHYSRNFFLVQRRFG